MKLFSKILTVTSASIVAGLLSGAAQAQTAGGTSGNNFGTIAENITTSIEDLPGLLTAVSYLAGLMFALMGVLKIKDHVEQPTQHKLKDGAIALAAGGGLFALPAILEAMQNTIGSGDGVDFTQQAVDKVKFNVSQ